MNAETQGAPRRKRKAPPRAVPSVVSERPPAKPVIFGWGADLNHREREALKEKIALFGGILLAVVLVGLLGWGALQDYVLNPAAVAAENNKPVAQVGPDVIHLGFYKRYLQFENTQLTNQETQVGQQLSALQADPKKNAAQISQLQQQQAALQAQASGLNSSALTSLIEDEILHQRHSAAGVALTQKDINNAMTQLMHQAGGVRSFQSFISRSGLSRSEIQWLVTSDYLRNQVGKKLSASVSHSAVKVRASHILVATKDKALAERIYHQVLNGANFAALARKYSIDPASKVKGGDLGYFSQGTMVPPFDRAAFSMKVGQIRLVKSQYGWHIIKVTGREMAKLTPTEYQQAQSTALQNWLSKEEAQLHVQHFMAPSALPTPVTTPNPLNNLTNPSNSVQTVPAPVPVATVPVPTHGKSTSGKTSTGTSGKTTTKKP